jgi:4-hydroxy-4-methyl-2-oxoglutarate aldolase
MRRMVIALTACILWGASPLFSQIQLKLTKEQMIAYTSEWKGERFADGRPKLPDDLLKRAVGVSIEDAQSYIRSQGYNNQFEGGWLGLHIDQPFAGRAVTAQFLPRRPDMANAIAAVGKAEGRVGGGTNSWVINELVMGDTMVADGFGKIAGGTLIGSNLGSAIAGKTHSGFIFDAAIRDAEDCRKIPFLNGFYRGYDPAGWSEMQLASINAPIRIGRAVVMPGDLVLAKTDGVIFIPAQHAAEAIKRAEFTGIQDAYNYELNASGANAGVLEGGWTPEKYAGLLKWVDAHPEKLKMSRAEFGAMVNERIQEGARGGRGAGRGGAPPR